MFAVHIAEEIFLEFSVVKHWRKLKTVNSERGYLDCLMGLRVILTFGVIVGHQITFIIVFIPAINLNEIFEVSTCIYI